MFPDRLDGAEVLYFTPKDNYGTMRYTTGELAACFKYLSICKYENSEGYYLFKCNEDFEVESDSLWNSIDECMGAAERSYGGNILWINKRIDKGAI